MSQQELICGFPVERAEDEHSWLTASSRVDGEDVLICWWDPEERLYIGGGGLCSADT